MYKDLSYIRDIHIIAKVLGFLFFALSICCLNVKIAMLFFLVFFFLIFQNIFLFLLELFLLVLAYVHPFFFILLKITLVGKSFFVFLKTIQIGEVRYFLEGIFYGRHSASFSYLPLSFCFLVQKYVQNVKDFLRIHKMYGKEMDFKKWIVVLRKSYEKSRRDVSSLMLGFQYRFYRSSNARTYFEKSPLTSFDLKYVLVSVILLFLVFVYGR